MQIDFHHAVTYVAARLADFSVDNAKKISYCAQYVDDAVNSGTIKFRNKAMYNRISSAHKMLDYRNFEELANHHVWLPFHFLPGNDLKPAGENPTGDFIHKIVCRPDSYVAKDMVVSCINDKELPYGIYRLGVTMHVLADTFAHQGFAGINHKINEVSNLVALEGDPQSRVKRVMDYFRDMFDRVANRVVSDVMPLGHGGALTCPDMPFLKWKYKNGEGKEVERDNTAIFMDAVECLHLAMVRYQKGDPDYQLTDDEKIGEADLNRIRSNFETFRDEEGEDRHEKWLESIANGDFSFASKDEEVFSYIAKGKDSWKYQALDTKKEVETKKELYRFNPDFMESDWKLFHDALQIHRIDVIRNILPRYGICAA